MRAHASSLSSNYASATTYTCIYIYMCVCMIGPWSDWTIRPRIGTYTRVRPVSLAPPNGKPGRPCSSPTASGTSTRCSSLVSSTARPDDCDCSPAGRRPIASSLRIYLSIGLPAVARSLLVWHWQGDDGSENNVGCEKTYFINLLLLIIVAPS